MIVKVCGITNAEDALAAVEAGASALGFNFYPKSPRFIQPDEARVIAEQVSTVVRVGVFVDVDPAEIIRLMNIAMMDVAQVYRSTLPKGVRTWRARNVDASFHASELEDSEPEAFYWTRPRPVFTVVQGTRSIGVACRRSIARLCSPVDWTPRTSSKLSGLRSLGAWTRALSSNRRRGARITDA